MNTPMASEKRGRHKRRWRAARPGKTVVIDGLLLAQLSESLRLAGTLPDGKPVRCRRCGEWLGVVATREAYATLEAHDVHLRHDDGTHLVGRSPPVIKRGRGVLIRRCLECGFVNAIRRGKCK